MTRLDEKQFSFVQIDKIRSILNIGGFIQAIPGASLQGIGVLGLHKNVIRLLKHRTDAASVIQKEYKILNAHLYDPILLSLKPVNMGLFIQEYLPRFHRFH